MLGVLLSIALLGAVDDPQGTPYRVDLIELNHIHNEKTGRHVVSQYILWSWCDATKRMQVVDYVLAEKAYRERLPNREVEVTYREKRVIVRSRRFRESRTTYDPEMIERDHYRRQEQRVGWIWYRLPVDPSYEEPEDPDGEIDG